MLFKFLHKITDSFLSILVLFFKDYCQTNCVADKAPSEATFRGVEYLYYDLSRTGGEPIVSTQDSVSLYFKTRHPSGLLFHTG